MYDDFKHPSNTGLNELSHPRHLAAVTPHDTNSLANAGILFIETGGDLKVTTVGGTTATVTVPDNFWFPVVVDIVFSTGTTATGITVFY